MLYQNVIVAVAGLVVGLLAGRYVFPSTPEVTETPTEVSAPAETSATTAAETPVVEEAVPAVETPALPPQETVEQAPAETKPAH